jgi:glycerol-3-phosphate dehydrogenase
MRRDLTALADGSFDLLVLGGGITGAGVALDAALRGLRVALIDKGDFASGTSSVSSKLVHGGLRYLEHGGIRLVYEALHERKFLLQNAPHLVQPLRFIIPFYDDVRVAPWKWRAGLVLYDLLAGAGNLHRSHPLDPAQLQREFPGLRAADLAGGAEYWDAQMEDARVCIEVLRTAAGQGACLANYIEAIAFEEMGEAPTSAARVIDHVAGTEFTIRATAVLNATGPWVDVVCRLAGDTSGPHLQPTKGVHLVAPDRGLSSAFLLLHPIDGRVFFVIPWLGKTLIGTTDTPALTPPDDLHVTDEEIDYLLDAHNHYFPPLERREVLGSFAGLRPLIQSRANEPSSQSREFKLFRSPSGMLTVAGGKYTTYRRMAEIVVDQVMRQLGRHRRCRTRDYPLDGAPRQPWEEFLEKAAKSIRERFTLAEHSVLHLLHRYGQRAADVASYVSQTPGGSAPVVTGEPDLCGEFAYQREHEMAIYPADFLLRRTRLGLFHTELLARGDAVISTPSAQ